MSLLGQMLLHPFKTDPFKSMDLWQVDGGWQWHCVCGESPEHVWPTATSLHAIKQSWFRHLKVVHGLTPLMTSGVCPEWNKR
jgi:hypothetical protein